MAEQDSRRRVQFDFSDDLLDLLDALKEETDSTRVGVIRTALKRYNDHLQKQKGPRRLVLGTVQELPLGSRDMLETRLMGLARTLCEAGFSRAETLQVCLNQANLILNELCLTWDPPINPMAPEREIARALIHAMKEYQFCIEQIQESKRKEV